MIYLIISKNFSDKKKRKKNATMAVAIWKSSIKYLRSLLHCLNLISTGYIKAATQFFFFSKKKTFDQICINSKVWTLYSEIINEYSIRFKLTQSQLTYGYTIIWCCLKIYYYKAQCSMSPPHHSKTRSFCGAHLGPQPIMVEGGMGRSHSGFDKKS